MIQKKKWIEILQENNTGVYALNQQGLIDLMSEVDLLFSKSVLGNDSSVNLNKLSNIYAEIVFHLVTNTKADNYWADMPIFVSSWNWKNKTPFGVLVLRLTQYLGFYKKILTDNGLARSVVTHRTFANGNTVSENGSNTRNTSSTTQKLSSDTLSELDKNIISKTPQASLASFDDMINYVSEATKNDKSSTLGRTESGNDAIADSESSQKSVAGNSQGVSDLDVTSKSWDEEEKNMKLVFYNDLCDYIRQIPQWIYSQYSLDSMPSDEIVRQTFEYFRAMYERR